jgi:hypothetical protein
MRSVTMVYANYLLNLQLKQVLKLDDALLGQFGPLIRAAKRESDSRCEYANNNKNNNNNIDYDGDDVIVIPSSINELNVAAAKAII